MVYVNCKFKAEFPSVSCCFLAAVSRKNEESYGKKVFEVYHSYITVVSNIFKQKKNFVNL